MAWRMERLSCEQKATGIFIYAKTQIPNCTVCDNSVWSPLKNSSKRILNNDDGSRTSRHLLFPKQPEQQAPALVSTSSARMSFRWKFLKSGHCWKWAIIRLVFVCKSTEVLWANKKLIKMEITPRLETSIFKQAKSLNNHWLFELSRTTD